LGLALFNRKKPLLPALFDWPSRYKTASDRGNAGQKLGVMPENKARFWLL
jgi:hypothetical protein